MLKDWHAFEYHASILWPDHIDAQIDWGNGIRTVEHWLNKHVGNDGHGPIPLAIIKSVWHFVGTKTDYFL